MRAIKVRLTVGLIIACIVAAGGARVSIAVDQCDDGCVEGSCFRLNGECFAYLATVCVGNDVWAYYSSHAIGGECSAYNPSQTVGQAKMNFCNRECAQNRSRAHDGAYSTCAGFISESFPVKRYCQS
jgi:hypothetical protein